MGTTLRMGSAATQDRAWLRRRPPDARLCRPGCCQLLGAGAGRKVTARRGGQAGWDGAGRGGKGSAEQGSQGMYPPSGLGFNFGT